MGKSRKPKGRKLPGPFTAFPESSEQTLAEFARLNQVSVEELRHQPFGFRLAKGVDTQAVLDIHHVGAAMGGALSGANGSSQQQQELTDLPFLLPLELVQQNKTRHLSCGLPFCIRDFMEESLKTIPLDHTDPNLLQEKLKSQQRNNRLHQQTPPANEGEWHTGLTSSSSEDSEMEEVDERRRLVPSSRSGATGAVGGVGGLGGQDADEQWTIDEQPASNSASSVPVSEMPTKGHGGGTVTANTIEPFAFGLRCFPSLHSCERLNTGDSNGGDRSSPLHAPLSGSGASGSTDQFIPHSGGPLSPLQSGVDVTLPFHHRRVQTHRRRVQVAVEKEVDRRLGKTPGGAVPPTSATATAAIGLSAELEQLKSSLERELNQHPTLLSMGRTFASLEDGDQPQEPRLRRKGGHRAYPGPVDFLLRANLHKAFLPTEEEKEWIRTRLVSRPPRPWHESGVLRRDGNM